MSRVALTLTGLSVQKVSDFLWGQRRDREYFYQHCDLSNDSKIISRTPPLDTPLLRSCLQFLLRTCPSLSEFGSSLSNHVQRLPERPCLSLSGSSSWIYPSPPSNQTFYSVVNICEHHKAEHRIQMASRVVAIETASYSRATGTTAPKRDHQVRPAYRTRACSPQCRQFDHRQNGPRYYD